ncbi:hypothetical protein IF1G_02267 [Cordyceps javanica]|uniref:Uncharacterized protein n=1 Tax=Cordyceps javanica TaxID=43265 RepID=A0A545VEB3_9HYPO|nr:hypothetical protein IF1G_02267 [Cordyceps javanica]
MREGKRREEGEEIEIEEYDDDETEFRGKRVRKKEGNKSREQNRHSQRMYWRGPYSGELAGRQLATD